MRKSELDLLMFFIFLMVLVLVIPWGYMGWQLYKVKATNNYLLERIGTLEEVAGITNKQKD